MNLFKLISRRDSAIKFQSYNKKDEIFFAGAAQKLSNRRLSEKYLTSLNQLQVIYIDNIIINRKSRMVTTFREVLFDENVEFLKRYIYWNILLI